MTRTKFGSAQAFLLEAIWSVDGMLKRNRFSSLWTILLFVVFSIPMTTVLLFPLWLEQPTWYFGTFLPPFLITLIMVSPWAFLSMTIYFYKQQLKLQTYAATLLFSWATLTQMLFILMRILDYLSSHRYSWGRSY